MDLVQSLNLGPIWQARVVSAFLCVGRNLRLKMEVTTEGERIANQMDDAGLDLRVTPFLLGRPSPRADLFCNLHQNLPDVALGQFGAFASVLRALSAGLNPTIHYGAGRQVAGHVDGCSAHVQDAIHANDQSNAGRWHADSLKDGRQHDYAHTRRAGRPNRGADRSARKSDQAPDVQMHAKYLS
jgi:hypothetical protein